MEPFPGHVRPIDIREIVFGEGVMGLFLEYATEYRAAAGAIIDLAAAGLNDSTAEKRANNIRIDGYSNALKVAPLVELHYDEAVRLIKQD